MKRTHLKSGQILITGAMGHIGSKLIRDSKSLRDKELILVDSFMTQRFSSIFNLRNPFQLFDIPIQDLDVRALFGQKKSKVTQIIHLAATTDATGTYNSPDLIWNNNLIATKAAIEMALQSEALLIFPSTTSVYGSQDTRVDESTKNLNPQSPYAECKIKEEEMILQAIKERGLRAIILRFGTIAGVSVGMRFHTAVNKFCWQATFNQPIKVWQTALNQVRPYLSISDAIQALDFGIDEKLTVGEIYNIVTQNASVSEILKVIETELNKTLSLEFVDSPIMNQLSYRVSNDKVKKEGFRFTESIVTDIIETLRILRSIDC